MSDLFMLSILFCILVLFGVSFIAIQAITLWVYAVMKKDRDKFVLICFKYLIQTICIIGLLLSIYNILNYLIF